MKLKRVDKVSSLSVAHMAECGWVWTLEAETARAVSTPPPREIPTPRFVSIVRGSAR